MTIRALTVTFTAQEVGLTVRDDGRRFDLPTQTDGYGLIGLRERAALIRAEVRVDSAPWGGHHRVATGLGMTIRALTVAFTAQDVGLTVRDDGHGFDLPTQTDGFGPVGLRERAALIRAEVRVDSTPGAGTTASLRVSA
ncbi:hypothetical protein [Actinokineospora cianjurensis]|uniref:Uncharacterized protein n=1 Tax=Actinokineospora cianjurensis TaxID=585224 RepID=A0A421B369_9PSEU|nr:hypothetical protein [Actinokineospora cianjurensis]RLK58831.1 hypothetical protein CLV68_3309 [Actinokineospora cianjurensis]